jgi:predicted ABC-type ATPase
MTEGPSNPVDYVIAGPNGAGKTTFARAWLPQQPNCPAFANADLIAQELSPLAPEAAAVRAGRLMLEQLDQLRRQRVDFAFETTLSGKGYATWLRRLKAKGYSVHIHFLWLSSVESSLQRVASRVRQGGHHIPEEDVRRRFPRGVGNFFELYRPLADRWVLYHAGAPSPCIIAYGSETETNCLEPELFAHFLAMGDFHV